MAVIKIFVSDNSGTRTKKANQLYDFAKSKTEPGKSVTMFTPQNSFQGEDTKDKTSFAEFSRDALEAKFSSDLCLIVNDLHRLSIESVKNLMWLSNEYNIDLCLLSRITNRNNGNYQILDILADDNREILELDNLGAEFPYVKRAFEVPVLEKKTPVASTQQKPEVKKPKVVKPAPVFTDIASVSKTIQTVMRLMTQERPVSKRQADYLIKRIDAIRLAGILKAFEFEKTA